MGWCTNLRPTVNPPWLPEWSVEGGQSVHVAVHGGPYFHDDLYGS